MPIRAAFVLSIVHTLICMVNNSWTYNVLYMNNYFFFGVYICFVYENDVVLSIVHILISIC